MVLIILQTEIPQPFLPPDGVTSVPVYIFLGVVTLFLSAIAFLLYDRRLLKKEMTVNESRHADDISAHIEDLKKQRENIYNLADAKTNIVLENLGKQITRLEIMLASFKRDNDV